MLIDMPRNPHSEVLTSPLRRANRTCELAGFGTAERVDADLVEWDYGKYEGLRRAEILKGRPAWKLFCDGCPGGGNHQSKSLREQTGS